MTTRYSAQNVGKDMAKAMLKDEEVSMKNASEVCRFFRYKTIDFTKKYMEAVLKKKNAIPFTRFNWGAGHRPGMGPGKYPIKTIKAMLKLVKSAEANAKSKGLGNDLKIVYFSARKAAEPMHYGRIRGISMKRSHIEIIVKEVSKKSPETKRVKDKAGASPVKKKEGEKDKVSQNEKQAQKVEN